MTHLTVGESTSGDSLYGAAQPPSVTTLSSRHVTQFVTGKKKHDIGDLLWPTHATSSPFAF